MIDINVFHVDEAILEWVFKVYGVNPKLFIVYLLSDEYSRLTESSWFIEFGFNCDNKIVLDLYSRTLKMGFTISMNINN